MESNWANLQQELLIDIAMKLECVEQLIRFSAVCSSWRAVYSRVKPMWTPSMPWLVMPEFHRSNSGNIRTVFDPSLNKSYQIDLPELFSCRCWGCRDGWIFTLSLNMEIHLVNPLTKTRLTLPSAHSIAYNDVDSFDCMEQTHFLREYIQKVVLLKVPPNNELVVVLICNYSKWIAYAKPGDAVWCYMGGNDPSPPSVKDVVSIGESFLILYADWSLVIAGMDCFMHPIGPTEYKTKVLNTESEKTREFDDSDIYLVDSSGYLLMVCPYYADFTIVDDSGDDEQNGGTENMITFDVFIFDIDTRRWDEYWQLEDAALFVGSGTSMSICASKATNCKQNCIYYVADKPEDVMNLFRWEPVNPLGKDIGIFDLEDCCLEEFYDGDYSPCSKYCPPFWFMPKLV